MDEFLIRLLVASGGGALLLAIVAAACGRLPRLSPAARHALWLVVLAKLLVPPLAILPLPVLPRAAPERGTGSSVDAAAGRDLLLGMRDVVEGEAPVLPEAGVLGDDPRAPEMPAGGGIVPEAPSPAPGTDPPADLEGLVPPGPEVLSRPPRPGEAPAIPWTALAAAPWAAGAAAVLFIELFRLRRLAFRLRDARPAPPEVRAAVSELARALGVRPPRVAVAAVGSPLVWGLLRPRLLLPPAMVERGAEDALRCVIVHELAHLRRRDHWSAWLLLAAGSVWWWNPVAWLARRQARENAELACDAWVAAVLPDRRRVYAEVLIATACRPHPLCPLLVPGMTRGPARAFERRLRMIYHSSVRHRLSLPAVALLAILGLAGLPAWSLSRAADEPGGAGSSGGGGLAPIAPGEAPGIAPGKAAGGAPGASPAATPGGAVPGLPGEAGTPTPGGAGGLRGGGGSPAGLPGADGAPDVKEGQSDAPAPGGAPPRPARGARGRTAEDVERRIGELESRIETLLEEVKSLRVGRAPAAGNRAPRTATARRVVGEPGAVQGGRTGAGASTGGAPSTGPGSGGVVAGGAGGAPSTGSGSAAGRTPNTPGGVPPGGDDAEAIGPLLRTHPPETRGGSQSLSIDLVTLATRMVEAKGEEEMAKLKLESTPDGAQSRVVAEVEYKTARRKLEVLRGLTEVALLESESQLDAARAEREDALKMFQTGVLDRGSARQADSRLRSAESRVRMMQQVLKGGQ